MRVRVSVLGAGNGGCAIAADLSRRGVGCTLFDMPAFAGVIDPIREAGGLRLTGVLGEIAVDLPRVTTEIGEAVEEADVLVVAVPAFAQATFAGAMRPHLRPGQTVVLVPGSTGGALAVSEVLRPTGGLDGLAVAETLSLPFACRKSDPVTVHIAGVKHDLPLAAFPARRNAQVAERLAGVFPAGISLAANVLETSLNNMNATAHPVPVVLNAGWIETTAGDFRFYTDGVSPAVARVMDEVDADRLKLVSALGLPAVPATEWDRRLYGLTGATTFELNRDSWVHRDIRAPRELRTRYLLEDVPFGLVPIASIAHELGIATPTIDLVVDLASLLVEQDLRAQGRTAASLGLAGLDAAGMLRFVETGSA